MTKTMTVLPTVTLSYDGHTWDVVAMVHKRTDESITGGYEPTDAREVSFPTASMPTVPLLHKLVLLTTTTSEDKWRVVAMSLGDTLTTMTIVSYDKMSSRPGALNKWISTASPTTRPRGVVLRREAARKMKQADHSEATYKQGYGVAALQGQLAQLAKYHSEVPGVLIGEMARFTARQLAIGTFPYGISKSTARKSRKAIQRAINKTYKRGAYMYQQLRLIDKDLARGYARAVEQGDSAQAHKYLREAGILNSVTSGVHNNETFFDGGALHALNRGEGIQGRTPDIPITMVVGKRSPQYMLWRARQLAKAGLVKSAWLEATHAFSRIKKGAKHKRGKPPKHPAWLEANAHHNLGTAEVHIGQRHLRTVEELGRPERVIEMYSVTLTNNVRYSSNKLIGGGNMLHLHMAIARKKAMNYFDKEISKARGRDAADIAKSLKHMLNFIMK